MLKPIALVALLVVALPARADVVVGVAGPMTGTFAPVGADMRAGVEAAVAAINGGGGIGGERLQVEVVDDKCDGPSGAAVANQLVGKVARLVVGHACTAAALPAAAVYAANGIVLISPAASNPRLTDERVGPGVFRLAARSDAQPIAIADHLLRTYRDRRVGFIHDGSVYGQGLVDAARTAFEAGGGTGVLTEAFVPDEKSQNALIGILQDAALTAVVIGGQQADAAVVLTAMRGRGLTADLIGGEALGLDEFRDLAGADADGVVFALPPDWRREPGSVAASESIRAAGAEPSGASLGAYAAVEAFAAAAGGVATPDAAIARLGSETFATAIGPVAFDAKGDLVGARWDLYVWRGGEPVPLP